MVRMRRVEGVVGSGRNWPSLTIRGLELAGCGT